MKTALALALVVTGITAAIVRADGLPVVGVDAGPGGVAAAAGDVRYVALAAGRDTVVARVAVDGGRVLRFAFLRGKFTVPAVAYDGSAGGLSGDGRTLVVIRPRLTFPRAETAFAILDARRLRLRGVVSLRGDFSFDAISPDGAWLYLVEYVAPRDPTRYLVRAYDLRAGRLLRAPVVDPRARGATMRGAPVTRAASPDGRWAYTLYDGAGKHPFIHALDTSSREARCIDLHTLAGRDELYDLRLGVSATGAKLSVVDGRETVVTVDTRTFRVREASEPDSARAPDLARPSDDGVPWTLVALAAAAVLLAAGVASLARRRRLAEIGAEPVEPAVVKGDGAAARVRRHAQEA